MDYTKEIEITITEEICKLFQGNFVGMLNHLLLMKFWK